MSIRCFGRKLFDGYLVASSNFVYTSNASADVDDGWVSARADNVTIQVCAATLNAITGPPLFYRIEGRDENNINRAASIYLATIGSSQSIDQLIVVSEKMREIRIGVKLTSVPASPLASPNYFYAGINCAEVC